MRKKETMSDATATIITTIGIGGMLAIAGLPLLPTVGIGLLATGGLAGICIANSFKNKEDERE